MNEMASLFMKEKEPREIKLLLQDLLTPTELKIIRERLQIVKRLLKGETQRSVKDQLGVAIATVTRGSQVLQHGNGSFQKFLKRKDHYEH